MELLSINKISKIINQKAGIIVYGAGLAGSYMVEYIKMSGYNLLGVVDKDDLKQGQTEDPYINIYSLKRLLELDVDYILVGFIENDKNKIESAIESITAISSKLLEKVLVIDFSEEWYSPLSALYTNRILNSMKREVARREKVEKVIFVTNDFTIKVSQTFFGGAAGALKMQQSILGNKYKDLSLEYVIYPEWQLRGFPYQFNNIKFEYFLQCTKFLHSVIRNNPNAVYISNDIFSAFGLSLLGQRYDLIYHAQGEFFKELKAFGWNKLCEEDCRFITEIEKKVMEDANQVFFPSIGARKYFLETMNKKICIRETTPLYNTIYDFPNKIEPKDKKNEDIISFLSVGQMTTLKGMDRIPEFLKKVYKLTKKKIKWIVVAKGELECFIENEIKKINEEFYECIEYLNINYSVSHQEIYELMANCDVYLMLHRISIFDFSTLEAMYSGKAVILSNIPGNDEFNKENNILLYDNNISDDLLERYLNEKEIYGKKNKEIYDRYFSKEQFKNRYFSIIDELTN